MSFSDLSAGTAAVSFISTVLFSVPDWMFNPWALPFMLIIITIAAGLFSHKVYGWSNKFQSWIKELVNGV